MSLSNLGRWTVQMRWWIIAFWALAFTASLFLAPKVTSALRSGFGEVKTESRTTLRLIVKRLGIPESAIALVFSSDSLQATDPRYAQELEQTVAPLRDLPQVVRVVTPYSTQNPNMICSDGPITYAIVQLRTDIGASVDLYPEIL